MKRDAAQLLQEASTSSIAVRTALLGVVPPRLIPAVWLNTDERPDVQKIVVAHRENGSGEVETFWLYAEGAFFLHFTLQSPVVATFWVAFPLPRWKEFLGLMARLGTLVIFTSWPAIW